MLRKVIGWGMIVALFAGLFLDVAAQHSVAEALRTFGFAAAGVIWVSVAAYLSLGPPKKRCF